MLKLNNTDIEITPVIMGCWQAGKTHWQGVDDDDSIQAMRAAYENGITTFDTAFAYGDGHSERVLNKALGKVRNKIVIADKVFPDMLKYDQVIESCHKSLENLGTDYIDLYQIHWPSGALNTEVVPIEETMRALVELKQQGKIRAIGVSNFSVEEMQEASQFGDIISLQPPYSLFWRDIEKEIIPYCQQHNMTVLAYSPLMHGLLTGRYTREHHFNPDEFRAKSILCRPDNYERAQTALDQLRPIAEQAHLSLTELAIGWLTAQPSTAAIVGARTAEQAKQNAQAMRVKLDSQQLQEIDRIGRLVTDHVEYDKVMWDM